MAKVSVTCVNYNTSGFIRDCLNSLKNQTFRDFEVIIFDNNSSDDSVRIIEREYPDAKLIKSSVNLGYCRGQNNAIRHAAGDLILALNPDIILEDSFISELVSIADKYPQAGSFAPKLYKLSNGSKTNIIDSAGHSISRDRNFSNIGDGIVDTGQYDTVCRVFGVTGAAPLYRKTMLEDIKFNDEYLDEDFFSGFDDVDIDWRSKLRGWETIYCPSAVAWHIRGGSTPPALKRKWEFHNYKNRYLLLIKNDSMSDYAADFPFIAVYEAGIFVSMLIHLQIFEVIFSVLSLLPRCIAKRRSLKRKAGSLTVRSFLKASRIPV